MSPIDRDYTLGQQYQKLRQHQACEQRMATLVVRSGSRKNRRYLTRILKAALYRLGQQLESIGNTLQIRYGDLKARPTD